MKTVLKTYGHVFGKSVRYICMLLTVLEVRIAARGTETAALDRRPLAPSSLFEPTLSRTIDSMFIFFPAIYWLTSEFVYAILSLYRLQTIRKKPKE